MKKSELRNIIRSSIKEFMKKKAGPLMEKDLFKCWSCEGGKCQHTGTQQGGRGDDCQSWWSCFKSCTPEHDHPGW